MDPLDGVSRVKHRQMVGVSLFNYKNILIIVWYNALARRESVHAGG